MAFNPNVKRLIVRDKKTGEHLPCLMCGKNYPLPDAVHIIDANEWKGKLGQDSIVNGIPLCPNCHRIFDEVFRPFLYKALSKFGSKNLPTSWKKNNKLSVTEKSIRVADED